MFREWDRFGYDLESLPNFVVEGFSLILDAKDEILDKERKKEERKLERERAKIGRAS